MNGQYGGRHAACPRKRAARHRRWLLCMAITTTLAGWLADATAAPLADAAADASGADASFDPSLLSGARQNAPDLSRFERGNPVLPGVYNVDIYLNNAWAGRRDIRFAAPSGQASATPCVDLKLLNQLDLHPEKLGVQLQAALADPSACVSIGDVIPDASMVFDMAELRLDTSVPQAYLQQAPRGYVSPEYWDPGVPAALLNYNLNSYRTSGPGLSQTTAYLGLNTGINVGLWHLRQDANLNWQSANSASAARHTWQNIDTYLQRDLPTLRAQVTLGDSFTDGQVFDSFGVRGIQLATDDRMSPESIRGYAPVVRGVADTNAKVTVRQNGIQIYQTTVAPGPFVIDDLYPTGYGGNLDVTVTEANGRVHSFTVPYASIAQLLRPGISRYDLVLGQLRSTTISSTPMVLQGTVQHGFTNLLTGYAGVNVSQGYASGVIGSAINTRFGALAFDLTGSHADIPGYPNQSGRSMRLTYSKIVPQTQTSISVAAYRYSSSGYLSLADAALATGYAERGIDPFVYVAPVLSAISGTGAVLTPAQRAALGGSIYNNTLVNTLVGGSGLQRRRNSFSLSVNQRLGQRYGAFYANVSANNYWNTPGTDTQFQLGYNNSFHSLTYGVSLTRSRDALGRYDNQYLLSLSFPLGRSAHAPSIILNMSHDDATGSQEQALLSGTAGEQNQFNYGLTASHTGINSSNSGAVNAGYRSPFTVMNGSYSRGNGYSQGSFGLTGAIVAHPGGVTFGQPVGDTIGIVSAPGADGATVGNSAGARVDRFGYAIVPYLSPYSLNTVRLDPRGLPLDVQLDATSAQVAPYAGAVVMLQFKTRSGRAIIARVHLNDGRTLPFGAEVFNAKGESMGVVGQAGQVLLRGVEQSGEVTAKWQGDNGTAESCRFRYELPASNKQLRRAAGYQEISTTCSRLPAVAMIGKGA